MTFNEIPAGREIPEVLIEFDSSRAEQVPAQMPYRVLLLGQKTAAGTGTPDTAYLVRSVGEVQELAGRKSVLRHMAEWWFRGNTSTEVWVGLLSDPVAGAQADGYLEVTGTAEEDGILHIYAGGETLPGVHFKIPIDEGDTQNGIATKIADAINADLDASVTAAVDGVILNRVNLTYVHKGHIGNSFKLFLNVREGEVFPAGLTVTASGLADGTDSPDLAGIFGGVTNTWFNLIVHPFHDLVPLGQLDAELTDRNGPTKSMDGVAIGAIGGELGFGGIISLMDDLNSRFLCLAATWEFPTNAYQIAAALGAIVAIEGAKDPGLPYNTVGVRGVLRPAEDAIWGTDERDLLLKAGASTLKVTRSGEVQIERLVTTYKFNAADQPDKSYKSLETMLTLSYLRYSARARLASKYSRSKVAADGTPIQPGQKVVTPSIVRSELVGWFGEMQGKGLVQNEEAFKANLVVQLDPENPGIIQALIPPDLIRQLLAIHGSIQFG